MRNHLWAGLAAALLLSAAPLGFAHSHGATTAFYGGQMADSGDLHVEFAVHDGAVRLWVRDHADQPVAASGKITLLVGGKPQDIPLVPQSQGLGGLSGVATVKASDKLTAVVTLTVQGKNLSLRFAQEELRHPVPLSPLADTGRQLFGQACASCHGTALRGSESGPPLLHGFYALGSGHGDDLVMSAIQNGAKSHHWKFGDMPKPNGVAPGQEAAVLAYIRSMQSANGFGPANAVPMDHSAHRQH